MNKFDGYTFSEANDAREAEWHECTEWSILEWAGAMCGEAGEAANIAKKIRRKETGLDNSLDMEELKDKLIKEIADTVTYAAIVASKIDRDLWQACIDKFNEVSDREGFSQKL